MLLNKEQVKIKNSYYTKERKPYELLGFIPLVTDFHEYYAIALDEPLPDSIVQYYVERNLWTDSERSSITHVSPVYGGYNPNFISDNEYYAEQEQSWKKNGLPHNKQFTFSDEQRTCIINYRNNNIYILFFLGCDDGDVALRFSNEKEASKFLSIIESFEDIMNNAKLIHIN